MTNNLQIVKLSQILDKVIDYRGKTPKKLGGEWSSSGYRALSALNVKTSGLDNLDQIRFLDKNMYKKWMKDEVMRGDILLTSEAPSGQIYFWDSDEKIVLSQRLFCLRIKKEHDAKFISYYLKSDLGQKAIFDKVSGSTVSGISAKMFDYISVITYSALSDEARIAAVLSALDDKIALNNKINAELEQMARTLYDYWFVQFDFPDANGKPYKSSGGQMAYNDQLKREIPAGWKAVQLEDILNKRTENAEPNSNLRCIDLSVMPSGSLSIDNFSAGDAFNSNMKKMHKNDILFGSIRPYLKKAGLAPFDGLRAGTVHAFYPRKPEHLEFCLITMTSERYFDYAINRSGGSTRMPSISSDDLLDYSVPFSEDVYFKYHKVLTSFTDVISNNIQQSQKLAELRDWLLPMLMNGQVKVV